MVIFYKFGGNSMEYFVGIDLGGTKICTIIIDKKGTILSRIKTKIGGEDNLDSIVDSIIKTYKDAIKDASLEEKDIISVGMAVPSSVNIETKTLIYAPNFGWKNIQLSKIISEKLKKPLFMDNDANMGIYGEYALGAAKGLKHIYGIFVGTGIGGGYIINDEIVRGSNFTAGEIGHIIVKIDGTKCNCGRKGCLEAIASKVGIVKYIKKMIEKKGEKTMLDKFSPDWKKSVGSSALHKALTNGDKVVKKAIIRSGKAIGIAAANIVNLIGVEGIILGGGVIEELGDFLIPIIKQNLIEYSMSNGADKIKLLKSTLGDNAVALGVAWFSSLEKNKEYLYKG